MLFAFKLSTIGRVITLLRSGYAPDPVEDQDEFDAKWAGRGVLNPLLDPLSPAFQKGKHPHHAALATSMEFQLTNARNNLSAIASEAGGYLNSYTILLAVVGVAVSTGKLDQLWSPTRLLIWPAALILILLWYVHASPLASWAEQIEGAGARAVSTNYGHVNDVRKKVIRFKVRINRSERILSVVHLLFSTCLVVLCAATTAQFWG
ncbi:MAG TPA: hypothetical protein VM581_04920 [Magnetospirillaceae bacterium]|nr:hypothetical protein [Magnetospirillaceae bacterium]